MNDTPSRPPRLLDNIAVALSGICLVHCLALPLLIAVLPFLTQFGEGHFHVQMLIVVLPVSIVAFSSGVRRHHIKAFFVLGGIGALLLILGGTVAHNTYGILADRALTILGALILAVSHYFNNRYSRHRITSQ